MTLCIFNKNFNTYMKGNLWGNPSWWKGNFYVTLPPEKQATLQIYSLPGEVNQTIQCLIWTSLQSNEVNSPLPQLEFRGATWIVACYGDERLKIENLISYLIISLQPLPPLKFFRNKREFEHSMFNYICNTFDYGKCIYITA